MTFWRGLHPSVVAELPEHFADQPPHIQAAHVHRIIGNEIGQEWRDVPSASFRLGVAEAMNMRRKHGEPYIPPKPAPTTPGTYDFDVASPAPGPSRQEEIEASAPDPLVFCGLCGAPLDFGVLGDTTRHRDLSRRVR